MTLWL